MKTTFCGFIVSCFCVLITTVSYAQSSSIIWQKTVGGGDTDSLTAMTSVSNNTFVMCGASKSKKDGNKSDKNYGAFDYWVVKMDVSGNIIWNKTFGGTSDDVPTAVITTSDGGYLVGGTSISNKSITKSKVSNKNSADYWVLKLDANGNKTWDKTIGGIYTDNLTSVTEVSPGKYVIGGYSFSNATGDKKTVNIGAENTADYWMLVLDKKGNIQSQSTFGGTSMDVLACVAPISASTVYLGGYSYSLKYSGYKTILPEGNNDFWVLKTDLAGHVLSELGFGGSFSEYITSMQALPDNSLILGGYSNSPVSGSRTTPFFGNTDYWTVKTKPGGAKEWDKAFGGSGTDILIAIQQTKDKGFILAGYSNSNASSTKTENAKGGFDYWIVKVDSAGTKQWDKTFGGSSNDQLAGIYELDNNQFILAGSSSSPASGDKTTGTIGTTGASDYWIMRIGGSSTLNKEAAPIVSAKPVSQPAISFSISPNPVTKEMMVSYHSEPGSKVSLVVYSSEGKMMITQGSLSSSGMHLFDVHGLSKGVYHVVMYNGTEKISKTFIKE